MRKIDRLRKEALQSCNARGAIMNPDEILSIMGMPVNLPKQSKIYGPGWEHKAKDTKKERKARRTSKESRKKNRRK